MKKNVEVNISKSVKNFVSKYVDLSDSSSLIIRTNHKEDIYDLDSTRDNIINLQKVNDLRYNNKFFEAVNEKLVQNGLFVGCVETYSAFQFRKQRFNLPIIKYFYFIPVFIFRRVFPKVKGLKTIYYSITKGKNRLISKAETLGRLVSCGFEIQHTKTIDGLFYFIVKKIKTPYFNQNPSYGPLFKMPRIGKDGKEILVYKVRTMHPFSEYLQEYMIKRSGYATTGKPANDFRVANWAKFLRKYWLDEIPQLINVLKGEMKLVGVRPVSSAYFERLPEEIKELRIKQKPGCIPPYVSLNRKSSVEEVISAERKYLNDYIKNPYFTDIRYFFNALYNIIIRGKRSA